MKLYRLSALSAGMLATALLFAVAGYGSTGSQTVRNASPSDLLASVKQRGELRIFSYNFPPEAGRNPKTNTVEGYDIDIWNRIAKAIGVKASYQFIAETAMPTAVGHGQLDSTVGHQLTPQRLDVMAASIPYRCDSQWMVVRSDSGITSLAGLKGKRVGSIRGSSEDDTLHTLAKDYGISTVEYDQSDPMYRDLSAGRLDALLWTADLISFAEKNLPNFAKSLKASPIAIPNKYTGGAKKVVFYFPKKGSSNSLINVVNKTLKQLMANGQMDAIFTKWGVAPASVHCPS